MCFHLYDLIAKTLKSIDPVLHLGGPKSAGSAWIPEFLEHVQKREHN